MTSKGLIIVDFEKKNEILKDIDKIKHFRLSDHYQKVALVEKEWYDGLIDWLQIPAIPPPGKIRVQKLFLNGKFNPKLQLHIDFEIIDLDVWEKLLAIFNCNAKLLKYCRKHPKTRKLIILIQPIQLSFGILIGKEKHEKIIKEVVDKNWEISLIKEHIGKKYKIENISDYALYQNDGEISITRTCGEIYDNDKSPIQIQKYVVQPSVLNKISEKYSHYPLQKNINNLPVPIETNQNNTNNHSHASKSSPRYQNSILNKYTNNYPNENSDSNSGEYVDSTPPMHRPISKLSIKKIPAINNNSKIIKPTAVNSQSSSSNSPSQFTNKNDGQNQNGIYLTSLSPSRSRRNTNNDNVDTFLTKTNAVSRYLISNPNNFPKPHGLRNLGNTCFFNAAVQCLIRCQSLTNFILSQECLSQINMKNPLGTKGKIVSAYRDLLQKMASGSASESRQIQSNQFYQSSYYSRYGSSQYLSHYYSSSISPTDLHSVISQQYPIFEDYGQNDAQELVGSLLDGLHEDLNQSYSAKGNQRPKQLSSNPDSYCLYLSKNCSPIMEIFNGKLSRSIKCPLCNHECIRSDPFMFLSLPIPSSTIKNSPYTSSLDKYGLSYRYPTYGRYNDYNSQTSSFKKVTLAKCFENFTKSETLDSHNLWKCENCRKEVNATVSSGITQISDILIIHLKRFETQSYYMKKIDTPVDYPDTLDSSFFQGSSNLSSIGNQNNSSLKFNLIGVVFHHGSLSGGHYTAAALDPVSKKWYEFNDSSVTPIQKEDAHSSQAYILFYEKCYS